MKFFRATCYASPFTPAYSSATTMDDMMIRSDCPLTKATALLWPLKKSTRTSVSSRIDFTMIISCPIRLALPWSQEDPYDFSTFRQPRAIPPPADCGPIDRWSYQTASRMSSLCFFPAVLAIAATSSRCFSVKYICVRIMPHLQCWIHQYYTSLSFPVNVNCVNWVRLDFLVYLEGER